MPIPHIVEFSVIHLIMALEFRRDIFTNNQMHIHTHKHFIPPTVNAWLLLEGVRLPGRHAGERTARTGKRLSIVHH